MARKYDRLFDPDMSEEEYEKIINETTAETTATQAASNAATSAAWGSTAITGAQAHAHMTGRATAGESYDYLSQKEQAQNKAQIDAAVQQASEPISGLPDEGKKPEEPVYTKKGELPQANEEEAPTYGKNGPVETSENQPPVATSPAATPAPETKSAETKSATEKAGKVESSGEGGGESSYDAWKKAQDDYNKKLEETESAIKLANENDVKLFSDLINERYNEKKAAEEEMQRQEKANMWASMATGATELAAGVINMFGVGGLNASNQQYKNYSADWMKKADQDIKDHRARRKDMRDTIERLKMQQQQVQTANRIEEMKLAQQNAKIKADQARQAWVDEEALKAKEKADKLAEEKAARDEKTTNASIAQGWARINDSRAARDANMRLYGYVPDKNSPGGYKYDPTEAAKGAGSRSSSSSSGSGSSSIVSYPIIDATGRINVAQLKTHEMETVLLNAREAIKQDLGDDDAKAFEKEFRRAADDKAKNAVLLKWMGKSKTCGDMIRAIDANYKGQHGIPGANSNQVVPLAPVDGQETEEVNPLTGLSVSYK